MGSLLHNDSRRLYSWWWDSHISPKNSKWLQENLKDMDSKVKAMIKLIEEDADSFSRRAEMYYKKRPELMKMVEEFYRAYRSLAERYDHATGALRQAHRTMTEAFPNQIPLVLTDNSPSTSSDTDLEPRTPEIPAPICAIVGPDGLHKDVFDLSPHFHVINRDEAKGLKQLNEMFSTGEGESHPNSYEGRVRKELQFPEEAGKISEYKTNEFPMHPRIPESSEKKEIRKELEHLKEQLSQLSSENKDLKLQIASQSEQAIKAKNEVQNLKINISKWNFEKEASINEYQRSIERISLLDSQVSRTQEDLKKLNDEMVMGALKLRDTEEQCVIFETASKSLQLDLDKAEQNTKTQKQELNQKLEELEKISILLKDEQQKRMEAELALSSVQKLHSQFALEHESGLNKLRNTEMKNMSLEEEVNHLKEENNSLSEQNASSILKIKDLQCEINVLKEIWGKFEDEMRLQIGENQVLLRELDSLKDDKIDLEQRHQSFTERMKAVSLNSDSLQALVKELQDKNVELKQICKKHEDEKLLLLENKKNMENIAEDNLLLENSLTDTNVELEGLREKVKTSQASCESLHGEIATHITEKSMLVSQVETFAQNLDEVKVKNAILENSQSDMRVELDRLRKMLKDLKEYCQTLHDENVIFLAENNNLTSQVESIGCHLENLKSRHADLEDEHSILKMEKSLTLTQLEELEDLVKLEKEQHELLREENQVLKEKCEVEQQKIMSAHLDIFILQRCLSDIKEMNLILSKDCQKHLEVIESAEKLISKLKDKHLTLEMERSSTLDQFNELECFMKLEKREHEALILSSKTQVATLRNEIHLLREENQFWKEKFEVEQYKVMSAHLDIFILHRCLSDIEETNLILSKDYQKHQEKIESAEKLISRLEQEDIIQKNEMMALSRQNEKLVHGLLMLSRVLNINEFDSTDGVKLESLLQIICGEIENMRNYISDAQDEILHLNLEISVIITLLKQIGYTMNDLSMEKVFLTEVLVNTKTELLVLERNKQDLLGINKNIKQDLQIRGQKEEELKIEIETLHQELSYLQGAFQKSQAEICMLLEENQILSENFYNMREEKDALEEENCSALSEAITFEHLFLLVKGSNAEIMSELKLQFDNMKQDLQIKGQTEEELKVDMEKLLRKLSDLQEAYRKSQAEICELFIENQSLLEKLYNLREVKDALEEENDAALSEAMTLEHMLSLFKSFSAERMLELKLHCDNMKQDLQISGQREVVLKVETKTLHQELSDLQEAYKGSQGEICKLVDENQYLLKKVHNLRGEKDALKTENSIALSEAVALEHLYMLYKSSNTERMLELKLHCDTMERELHIRGEMEKEMKVEMKKLRQQLSDLQSSHHKSQAEIGKLVDEKQYILQDFHSLRVEKDALEEENSVMISEAIALEYMYMLYKSFNSERTLELKLHGDYMKQEMQIRGHKEQELKVEMENLGWQLSNFQEACRKSEAENCRLTDENQSLSEKLCYLMEQKYTLEEENSIALSEAMILDHLYMLFKSFNTERTLEVKLHSDNMGCLHTVISNLDRKVSEMNRNMSALEVENIQLKESVSSLDVYRNQLAILEFDLNTAKHICEELNYQIETGNNLLVRSEMEISEANQKAQTMLSRNRELCTRLEGHNQEIVQEKMVKKEMEKMISSLSEVIAHRDKKIVHISEENKMMYSELRKMNGIFDVLSRTEEYLNSIVQTGRGEIDQCEVETKVLLNELHISTVSAAILEEKVYEMILLCESTEIYAMLWREVLNEEITSRNAYINELKKQFGDLEGENIGLKDNMNTYLSSIKSLQDSVVTLEVQALSLAGYHSLGTLDKQDNFLFSCQKHESSSQLNEEPTGIIPAGVLQLEKLIIKVKALANLMTDIGSGLEHERLDATRKIETEKGSSGQEEQKINTDKFLYLNEEGEKLGMNYKQQKDDANVSSTKYEHMKDIQLDQASSPLPHSKGAGSYSLTKTESSETDDQMLELWEAAEMDCTQVQKVVSLPLENDMEAVEEEKSEYFSSELVSEKELSLDRLEIPTKDAESHQERRRRVNERLTSDAQRLAAIQISIQELKRALGDLKNTEHARYSDHETVKVKLKEAEESLRELTDTYSKLTKNLDDLSKVQGSGSTEGNQISKQVRKMSEKVGSLELELQKLQYFLLKVKEEHENHKTGAAGTKSRAPLRDYLNGKITGVRQNKKGLLCGCIKPKTNVD